jgi:hypothetical protein
MWNTPTHRRLAQIPKLYETDEVSIEKKIIYLHFFIAGCDWYVAEFDDKDTFFGFVILNGDMLNAEWGNFSLSELERIKVIGWMEVDCELEAHWKIRPASQVEKICQVYGWILEPA